MRPSQYNYLKRMWTRNSYKKRPKKTKNDGCFEVIFDIFLFIFAFGAVIYLSTFIVIAIGIAALCVIAFLVVLKVICILFKITWPHIKVFVYRILNRFQKCNSQRSYENNTSILNTKETTDECENIITNSKNIPVKSTSAIECSGSAYENWKKKQDEARKKEQEILEYAMMCEKHAQECDYLEKMGIAPDKYEKS